MKIEISGNEAQVYPSGRIDIVTAKDFKNDVLSLIEKGMEKVYIDFSKVTAIDSSGLGKLLMFHKKLEERGGQLIIRNVENSYVRKMFSLVHLYKVITIEGLNPDE